VILLKPWRVAMKSLRTSFALLALIPFLNTLSFSQDWTTQTSGTTEWLSSVCSRMRVLPGQTELTVPSFTRQMEGRPGQAGKRHDNGCLLCSSLMLRPDGGWIEWYDSNTTNGGATWTSIEWDRRMALLCMLHRCEHRLDPSVGGAPVIQRTAGNLDGPHQRNDPCW
jgi:hypothetical protein